MNDWWENFMTEHKCFIAWDETQANELGRFLSYDTAKEAILKHAKTLNKKETAMDFQVGDKVVSLLNGKGTVIEINEDVLYPVTVKFGNCEKESFTYMGKLYDAHKFPCLFHEGTEINIKPAQPKRYPWVNIYLQEDGECMPGVSLSTKEMALKNIGISSCKYVDTIQLKPKEE